MSLTTYGQLGTDEDFTLVPYHLGKYDAILGANTDFRTILRLFQATILSFVSTQDNSVADGTAAATPTSVHDWLMQLKEIYKSKYGSYLGTASTDLLIMAVMHNSNASGGCNVEAEDTPSAAGMYSFLLGGGYATEGSDGDGNYIPYLLVENGTWANSLAEHFGDSTALDGTISDTDGAGKIAAPFTYVITKKSLADTGLYVAAKLHRRQEYSEKKLDISVLSNYYKLLNAGDENWKQPYETTSLRNALWSIGKASYTGPTVEAYPFSSYFAGTGARAKVMDGSAIRFEFSEKARGAQAAATYGIGGFADLIRDDSGSRASASADGFLASDLVAGYKEAWIAELKNLSGASSPIALAPTAAVEANGNGFVLSPTGALTFDVDSAGDVPAARFEALIVEDYAGTPRSAELVANAAVSAPNTEIVLNPSRALKVRVVTDYPGIDPPAATLTTPSGATLDLAFSGLVAADVTESSTATNQSGAVVNLSDKDSYSLDIPAYKTGAGVTIPHAIYNFTITNETALTTDALPAVLEGWGYYPREEGLPTASPEAGSFIYHSTVTPAVEWKTPAWAPSPASPTATPSAGSGSALVISKTASQSALWYSRLYDDGFAASYAYVEAVLACSGPLVGAPTGRTFADTAGTPNNLRIAGAGLRLRNGPYLCELALVEDAGSGLKKLGLRMHAESRDDRIYRVGAHEWDANPQSVLRMDITGNLGTSLCTVSVDGSPLTGLKDIPLSDMCRVFADDEGGGGAGEAAFGIFENIGQAVSLTVEYLRYAFYDAKYKLGVDSGGGANDLALSFPNIFRAGDELSLGVGPFYRSPDIKLDGLAGADPFEATKPGSLTVSMEVSAVLGKTVAGDLASKDLPVKIRFCLIDFDDSSAASIAGFTTPGNFPDYGAGEILPFAVSSPSTSALTFPATDATAESAALACSIAVSRTRLARRLFILAYADSPLLGIPLLVEGAPSANYFITTTSGSDRVDGRSAVRGFLPDYFVRDQAPGSSSEPYASIGKANGCLSPDIALAIFIGPTDSSHATPDPQAIGAVAHGAVAMATYPLGFARGEVLAASYLGASGTETMTAYDLSAADHSVAATVSISDTGWTDIGTTCFYNRMWVRLSNKGIVPGPANVQVFFLRSLLINAFDVDGARATPGAGYDPRLDLSWIWSDKGMTTFAQRKFQLYTAGADSAYAIDLVEAVPPLSGWATPTGTPEFVVAEFAWHLDPSLLPADTSAVKPVHGCRAICVNLPGTTKALTAEAASSKVDQTRAEDLPGGGAVSIWDVNARTNNVAVRNSNVLFGVPPVSDPPDPPVNVKCLQVDPEGEPETHQELPNEFQPAPTPEAARAGILVDASGFPVGDAILRVPSALAGGAKLVNLVELEPVELDEITGRPIRSAMGRAPTRVFPYRYYLLKGGEVGSLEGVRVDKRDALGAGDRKTGVFLDYRLYDEARPGVYKLFICQTLRRKRLGGYETTIIVPKTTSIKYVGDDRTGVVYDIAKKKDAIAAIPYGKRRVFPNAGFAVQEGYRFGPAGATDFLTGKIANGVVNIPRRHRYPEKVGDLAKLGVLPKGLDGAIVGRIIDAKGRPKAGLKITVRDASSGEALGHSITSYQGRYLLRLRGLEHKMKKPNGRFGSEAVDISAWLPGKGSKPTETRLLRLRPRDLFFIAPTFKVKA